MARPPQHWDVVTPERTLRVTVADDGWSRRTTWTVDGEVVAEKKSSEDKLVLEADGHGAVRVVCSAFGGPRQVTWFEPGQELVARTGIGGIDLDPEPGSKAALRDERMRAHPRRYAARHVVNGVAKVVLPILVTVLLARFAIRIEGPDWNLPSLPHPDLPEITDLLPDISWPDWSLPAWVREAASYAKFVVPVLVGIALARNEITRRKKQDDLKRDLKRDLGEGSDRTLGS